jgi:hypothetical protein
MKTMIKVDYDEKTDNFRIGMDFKESELHSVPLVLANLVKMTIDAASNAQPDHHPTVVGHRLLLAEVMLNLGIQPGDLLADEQVQKLVQSRLDHDAGLHDHAGPTKH